MSEELLKMIETVDPEDSTAIEEIEARYICFKMRDVYEGITYDTSTDETPMAKGKNGAYYFKNYATSRDVLKGERPKGWCITNSVWFHPSGNGACSKIRLDYKEIKTPDLPTEELAEFHAIIQAITYQRNEDRLKQRVAKYER